MNRYAVVDPENKVVNIILWDGASQWAPPDGHIAVATEEKFCDIGWTHSNGDFIKPEEPEPEQS